MNEDIWNDLSDADKDLILQCANNARDWQRETIRSMDQDVLKKFTEAGMTISEVDPVEWQEAMAPVYEQWQDKIGKDLIDQVKALAK